MAMNTALAALEPGVFLKTEFRSSENIRWKLFAEHMKKTEIYFNKLICLGMCILDLSKMLMYEDLQGTGIEITLDEPSTLTQH